MTTTTNGTGQVPPVSQASSTDDDSAHGNNASEPTSSNLSPEQLQDALKKARADAAKSRVDAKRLAELEAAEQQRKDAELSEKDRADKKIAEYQAQLADLERATQERIVRSDIRTAARELGLKPELALKLIDYAAIAFSEDGDPTNVAELLAQAAEEFGLAVNAPGAPTQQAAASQQQPPAAPQIGATNAPRGTQVAAANGVFARGEMPRNVKDPRLWKRGN